MRSDLFGSCRFEADAGRGFTAFGLLYGISFRLYNVNVDETLK